MADFTTYDPRTGAFIETYSMTLEMLEMNILPEDVYLEGAYLPSQCYADITSLPVVALPKTDYPNTVIGLSSLTDDGSGSPELVSISDLPNPCLVVWPDGSWEQCLTGVTEFGSEQPGSYVVSIESVKYLTFEVLINVLHP